MKGKNMSSILQYKLMNEFHFIKAIQTSGLTLKEYTLNPTKVRFELEEWVCWEGWPLPCSTPSLACRSRGWRTRPAAVG